MTKKPRKRALGQHFLKNKAVLGKIVRRISPHPEDLIIEIGAGRGALTFPLADKAGKVIAIEKDPAFIPHLRKKNIPNLVILEKDVLKVDFDELLKKETDYQGHVKLAGNLPYSLSSPLLFRVLGSRELFTECVFLLQKEVAERLSGQPGSKKYAPISILFQIYYFIQVHFTVPPDCFSPPPKVDSALVSLKKREQPLHSVDNEKLFHNFLKGAFRHRRKILRKNLEMMNIALSTVDKAYTQFNIERNTRPEQLPISLFVDLFLTFFSTK